MDNKRVLLKLDSELEHTINQLRSAKTLSNPLISEKDREVNAEPALKKTISENFEKARTVALGQLIRIDQVPEKYLRQYEPNPSRYWYRFDKGWKFSYIKYIPASRSLMLAMGKSADYKNTMLDRKALFFIDRRDRVTAVADVYNEESLIQQLGKSQWFWSGERLRERRR